MRGCTITHFLVLGDRPKQGVALNEESALNEVVRYVIKSIVFKSLLIRVEILLIFCLY